MSFQVSGESIHFERVDSDSVLFGWPVYGYSKASVQPNSLRHLFEAPPALSKSVTQDRFCLIARVPSADVALRVLLHELGMRVMEQTLHPTLEKEDFEHSEGAMRVGLCQDSDTASWLLDQAESSFEFSRYHRDPLVPDGAANKRFRNWVEAALDDSSKQVLTVGFPDETLPAGWFVTSIDGGQVFLELTAMASHYKGRGFAHTAWSTLCKYFFDSGAVRISTNISAENSALLRLYPKLGFKFGSPSVALHGHFDAQGLKLVDEVSLR